MGFLLGLLTGIAASIQNTQIKSLPKMDSRALNGVRFFLCVPVLALLVTIFASWHIPPHQFFIILLIDLPLEALIAFCYVKAFQYSPQSLVGPLFSLSVILLVPVSFFVFGITPNIIGWLGITLGLIGTFFLGWDLDNPNFKESLKVIFREKGTYYMLAATVCSVATVTLVKFSYRYAPALVTGFYVLSGLALFYIPFLIRQKISIFKGHWKHIASLGLSTGTLNAFHYVALSLLPPAYFISLKRSSIFFDVILGKYVHGESHFKGRLIGSLFMVSGIILIAFAQ